MLIISLLRGTPFKWLDVVALFDAVLAQRAQNERLECVNLFTAPALANFATNGSASVDAQARHGERFETIYDTHTFDKSGTLLPTFVPGRSYNRNVRARVWKSKEKKRDVNLVILSFTTGGGLGLRPLFLIRAPEDGDEHMLGNGQMAAFTVADRDGVDRAYRLALKHGGSCAGAPGLRPAYHADHCGAYMRDYRGQQALRRVPRADVA